MPFSPLRSSFLAVLLATAPLAAGCVGTSQSTSAARPTAPETSAAAAETVVTPMPVPDGADTTLQRLAGSVLVGGRSLEYLRELCDRHGPRLSGSKVLADAARWSVEEFKRAGINNAKIEEFTISNGWERREATARIVSPSERPIRIAAVGWSTPTPPEGIRAPVVLIRDIEEALRRPEELRGKILFFSRRPTDKPKKGAIARSIPRLNKAGIAGILFHQRFTSNHVFHAHAASIGRDLVSAFHFADVSLEDGVVLERALEKGPVTMEIVNTSPVSGPVGVPNVVAELPGSERPEEVVLVGAHLDAWDFATGAQDNGSGVAQVLEAARAMAVLGRAPKRTIRFVLWGGEEQGLLGSRAYVKAHAGELDRIVAVLNTDHGAGAPKGWVADGRPDVVKRFEPLAKSILSGLGSDALRTDIECDTDHCPFWLAGIPTLNLDVDPSGYGPVHHQSSDTFDKVQPGALAAGAAVLAVTTFALADAKERIAPRRSRAAVTAQIKEDKELTEILTLEGLLPL